MDRAWRCERGTKRLLLTPLDPQDADEMVEVLADPRLHQFIGGRPATLQELRSRYATLTAGSSSPDEVWRNWVVRRRADRRPVGIVQATLTYHHDGWTAHIAWITTTPDGVEATGISQHPMTARARSPRMGEASAPSRRDTQP